MQHIYLKYPPSCALCHKQPTPKIGIWHDNEREIYICNECHDKEAEDDKHTDTLEA